ncbi:MAG: hypothetical protein L0215_20780 [Gemmataceae bacterium]|nr:hypothetical protein [Gemmataceae bacterium]
MLGKTTAYGPAVPDAHERHFVGPDAATGRALHVRPLQGPYFQLAFSPDGARLAAIDREEVKLWDVESGKELLLLRGAPQRSADNGFNPRLVWSADGRRLASSNWDASISVWNGDERQVFPAALGPK